MSDPQGAAGGGALRPTLRLVARDERRGTTVVRDAGPEGLTIGRSPDSGMALPDLDRFVSGRHAVIDHADGQFRLTDVSTNGTFVNGEAAPLGPGQTRVLRPGDRLRIGLYEILVETPEPPRAPPAAPVAAEAAAPVPLPSLPAFGAAPDTPPAAPPPAPDDAARPEPPGGVAASDVLASLVSDLIGGGPGQGGTVAAQAPAGLPHRTSPEVPNGVSLDMPAALPTRGAPSGSAMDLSGDTSRNMPPGMAGAAAMPGVDPTSVPVSPFAAFETTGGDKDASLFGLPRPVPAPPPQKTVGTASGQTAAPGISLPIDDLLHAAPARTPLAGQPFAGHPLAEQLPPAQPSPGAGMFDAPLPPASPPMSAPPTFTADEDAAIAGQAIQLRLPGVPVDGRPADPATLALAAFWAGFGSFPGDLRASELPALMHQLGAALREACDGADDLLAEAEGGRRFGGGRASAGRLRRLLTDRNRDAPRLDEAMRDAFERAAGRRRAYASAVEAGLHTVTDTLSAAALATRFTEVIRAIGRRRRESELWRLFALMGNELKQLAELRFQKEVDAHMRRHDEQRQPPGPLPPDPPSPGSRP